MANEFVQKLSEMDSEANYRLPTEFEWEYAASAGTGEMISWKEIRKQAWIQATRNEGPKEVGQMQPNEWGIYDMLGNVWEWVSDFHNGDVLPEAQPPANGDFHVLKGGGFTSDVVSANPFFHGAGPGNQYDVGFRVVRIKPQK
jgi:formylglycine-generating enzyme